MVGGRGGRGGGGGEEEAGCGGETARQDKEHCCLPVSWVAVADWLTKLI